MTAPIVETTHGKLRGLTEAGIHAFKGIQYAAPPTPQNRFKAPQPVHSWPGIRDATTFAPQARQIIFDFLDPAYANDPTRDASRAFHQGVETAPIPYDEDCLALNIWTPSTTGARPVMVWLHGGGFASGSGSWAWWTGEDLARNQDVVTISLNHRLNIAGFLYLDELGGPAHGLAPNCGMRDIVQALHWIRDNIANFGGDPNNITIFGQSGGGMKVTTLLAMPMAKGLFHKAIVQSGPFLRAVPRPRATAAAERALAFLGIAPGHLEKLQAVPADALIAAFANANEGAPGILRQFAPVIDGTTLTTDPYHPAAPPTATNIPLLIGATSEEITSLQGFRDPSIFTLTEADLPPRLATFCGIEDATPLIAAYRATRPHATPAQLYAAIASDRQFGHGSILQAEAHAAQAPTFAYRLIWQSPAAGGRYGAPHNLCLPLVFGRDRAPGVTGPGTAHHALATFMQSAWATFARTGSPGWAPFSAQSRTTMILDQTIGTTDNPNPADYAAQSALPPRL